MSPIVTTAYGLNSGLVTHCTSFTHKRIQSFQISWQHLCRCGQTLLLKKLCFNIDLSVTFLCPSTQKWRYRLSNASSCLHGISFFPMPETHGGSKTNILRSLLRSYRKYTLLSLKQMCISRLIHSPLLLLSNWLSDRGDHCGKVGLY